MNIYSCKDIIKTYYGRIQNRAEDDSWMAVNETTLYSNMALQQNSLKVIDKGFYT